MIYHQIIKEITSRFDKGLDIPCVLMCHLTKLSLEHELKAKNTYNNEKDTGQMVATSFKLRLQSGKVLEVPIYEDENVFPGSFAIGDGFRIEKDPIGKKIPLRTLVFPVGQN